MLKYGIYIWFGCGILMIIMFVVAEFLYSDTRGDFRSQFQAGPGMIVLLCVGVLLLGPITLLITLSNIIADAQWEKHHHHNCIRF
jgi:hypothetical protein